MVKPTRSTAGSASFSYLYNDDYLDDILGDTEPYVSLKATESAQLIDDNDDEDSDEEVFIVEKILDKKKEGRRLLYLVKWEGYEEKDATWEPVGNLGNVKELVREYDKQIEMCNVGNNSSTNLSNETLIEENSQAF